MEKLKSALIDYSVAVSNKGNNYRMKKLMARAEAGEKLNIAFLGGSITQGSVATRPELCYAYRVFEWWKDKFPQAEFTYINAGIGGTTSQFGAARAAEDLLSYEPDFVIIEFSVNDDPNEHFMETYEGLVRKVYTYRTEPAVMLVHNVFYNNGANSQLMHSRIGRHYGIPSVSMQSTVYQAVVSGRIPNRDITPDDLHPNDAGHELVASVITYGLEEIMKAQPDGEPPRFPEPLTANAYEDSVRYRNINSGPELAGFVKDTAQQSHITDCFKYGWTAGNTGDAISFEVEGSCIAVQFRKSVRLPAPVAEIVIDGDESTRMILDANFDETWGDKLELYTVMEHGENKKHKVDIRLIETHPDDAAEFYLVSVIGSGR